MPKTNPPGVEKSQLKECQQVQAKYCNRTTKELPTLSEGDVVRMKPFKLSAKSWPKAQVTAKLDERLYTLEAENGATGEIGNILRKRPSLQVYQVNQM